MADVVTSEVRSHMIASIRASNTSPELFMRRGLHRLGFRFRLDVRSLPRRPDLVFPKYQAVLFVHGCFWHRHNCHLFKWPASRVEFWRDKLEANAARDRRTLGDLRAMDWRVGIVWECAIKSKRKWMTEEIFSESALWLRSDESSLEISSR